MNRKTSAFVSLLLAVTMIHITSAEVILQCDIGTDKSYYEPPDLKLKPGWTLITPPNVLNYTAYKEDHPGGVTVTDVNGTGIDLHFDVGNHITLSGRDRYAEFPAAEALAIDYFMADDVATVADGIFYLTLRNLSAGKYRLKSYHNNPAGSYRLIYQVLVSGAVSASIGASDVPITGELLDENIGTGTVSFVATGGGDVTINYIGLDAPGYSKDSPFNAFELFSEPIECPCTGDMNTDDQIDLDDLQAVAGILLDAGAPFIVLVDEGHCADMNDDGQVDLDDLQLVAGVLLDVGSPFIAACE